MNNISLIGRLTRDPAIRYTSDQKCIAAFVLAVRRDKEHADFFKVKVFGRQAEAIEKYIKKGRMLGVSGRMQMDSYKKESGETVNTYEVIASMVDFVDDAPKKREEPKTSQMSFDGPDDFEQVDEDIPF